MANRVALVTGASSGIGAEFARQLGADGFDLVLVARRADRLEELRADIEKTSAVRCHVVASDLSLPEAPRQLFAETESRGLQIDWLVNNAGFGTHGRFVHLPLEREIEQLQLNVTTPMLLTHFYLAGMIARKRGRIINLGSVGAFVPTPYMAAYSATKAFIMSFSEGLDGELSGTGVAVLVLCPGATRTSFQDVAGISKRLPGFAFMDAASVVREAIAAAKRGKRTLVPGWKNKLTVASMRFTPRNLLIGLVGAMFEPKGA